MIDYLKGHINNGKNHLENLSTFFSVHNELERFHIKIINEKEFKTLMQNNALHALIQEMYTCGGHSARESVKSLKGFRSYIKTDIIGLIEIETYYNPSTKQELKRKIGKSVSKYTKKEMTQAIENVLAYIDYCGINTKKMEDIRDGMDKLGLRG